MRRSWWLAGPHGSALAALVVACLAIFVHPAHAAVDGPCSNGVQGVCLPVASCAAAGGVTSVGNCPFDPNDILCCSSRVSTSVTVTATGTKTASAVSTKASSSGTVRASSTASRASTAVSASLSAVDLPTSSPPAATSGSDVAAINAVPTSNAAAIGGGVAAAAVGLAAFAAGFVLYRRSRRGDDDASDGGGFRSLHSSGSLPRTHTFSLLPSRFSRARTLSTTPHVPNPFASDLPSSHLIPKFGTADVAGLSAPADVVGPPQSFIAQSGARSIPETGFVGPVRWSHLPVAVSAVGSTPEPAARSSGPYGSQIPSGPSPAPYPPERAPALDAWTPVPALPAGASLTTLGTNSAGGTKHGGAASVSAYSTAAHSAYTQGGLTHGTLPGSVVTGSTVVLEGRALPTADGGGGGSATQRQTQSDASRAPSQRSVVTHPCFTLLAGPNPMGDRVDLAVHAQFVVEQEFHPSAPDEIALTPGDTVTVKTCYRDGWGRGWNAATEQVGMFPLDCLHLPSLPKRMATERSVRHESAMEDHADSQTATKRTHSTSVSSIHGPFLSGPIARSLHSVPSTSTSSHPASSNAAAAAFTNPVLTTAASAAEPTSSFSPAPLLTASSPLAQPAHSAFLDPHPGLAPALHGNGTGPSAPAPMPPLLRPGVIPDSMASSIQQWGVVGLGVGSWVASGLKAVSAAAGDPYPQRGAAPRGTPGGGVGAGAGLGVGGGAGAGEDLAQVQGREQYPGVRTETGLVAVAMPEEVPVPVRRHHAYQAWSPPKPVGKLAPAPVPMTVPERGPESQPTPPPAPVPALSPELAKAGEYPQPVRRTTTVRTAGGGEGDRESTGELDIAAYLPDFDCRGGGSVG